MTPKAVRDARCISCGLCPPPPELGGGGLPKIWPPHVGKGPLFWPACPLPGDEPEARLRRDLGAPGRGAGREDPRDRALPRTPASPPSMGGLQALGGGCPRPSARPYQNKAGHPPSPFAVGGGGGFVPGGGVHTHPPPDTAPSPPLAPLLPRPPPPRDLTVPGGGGEKEGGGCALPARRVPVGGSVRLAAAGLPGTAGLGSAGLKPPSFPPPPPLLIPPSARLPPTPAPPWTGAPSERGKPAAPSTRTPSSGSRRPSCGSSPG